MKVGSMAWALATIYNYSLVTIYKNHIWEGNFFVGGVFMKEEWASKQRSLVSLRL